MRGFLAVWTTVVASSSAALLLCMLGRWAAREEGPEDQARRWERRAARLCIYGVTSNLAFAVVDATCG
jgi:hypothetical protein